jgi:methionine-rich copper-binding protein CopC
MKKTLILLFTIVLGSTAFAQQKTIEVNPTSGSSKKAIQTIELSADQKEKLTKINRFFNKQRQKPLCFGNERKNKGLAS